MIHDMNDDDLRPFDDANREREWLAQENAMRRERLLLHSHNDDAKTKRYRMLARALRQPMDENLPPDFARRLSAQARATPQIPRSMTFELGLTALLCLILLVSSIVVSMKYGGAWLHPLIALSPSTSSLASWRLLQALAACMAFTGLVGRIRPPAKKH